MGFACHKRNCSSVNLLSWFISIGKFFSLLCIFFLEYIRAHTLAKNILVDKMNNYHLTPCYAYKIKLYNVFLLLFF